MNTDISYQRVNQVASDMGTKLEQILHSSKDAFKDRKLANELQGYANRLKNMHITDPPRRIKTTSQAFKPGLDMLKQAQKLAAKAYLALNKSNPDMQSTRSSSRGYTDYITVYKRNLQGILLQLERAIYLSQKEIQDAPSAVPAHIKKLTSSDLEHFNQGVKESNDDAPYQNKKRSSSCCGDFDTDVKLFFGSHLDEMQQVKQPSGDTTNTYNNSNLICSSNAEAENLVNSIQNKKTHSSLPAESLPVVLHSPVQARSDMQMRVLIRPSPSPKPTTTLFLEDKPTFITCKKCGKSGSTLVERKASRTAWVLCGATSMLGLVCGCCLVPFLIPSLSRWKHYCPNCKELVGVTSQKDHVEV